MVGQPSFLTQRPFKVRTSLSAGLGAGARLLASHLAFNCRHQPDMDHFGNFPRLHPLVQLDSPLSGVENHITLRTVADVRLQFSAHFRVHRHIQVIGKLLQELFTGKQRRSSPFASRKKSPTFSHNCRRTRNKRLLTASTQIPRASVVSLSLNPSMSRNTKTARQTTQTHPADNRRATLTGLGIVIEL
jgi:hypothetical protein